MLTALLLLAAEPIIGTARVVDGDTLVIADGDVRLFGIDAPELSQTCERNGQKWSCGQEAGRKLAELIAGRTVACAGQGTDRFGRTVARCRAGETDLNRLMVATGYAVAFRRYSQDYVSAEEAARVSRRGMWAGTFDTPEEVRHSEQSSLKLIDEKSRGRAVVRAAPTSDCRIKGNRSRRGEWIYHLPGMPYYGGTRAKQMFCTQAEARAAGYRRSRAR